MKIEIEIPDGKYCTGCKFLHHKITPLVNMFGDPTGNCNDEYVCSLYENTIQMEEAETPCGMHYMKPVKMFPCGETKEQMDSNQMLMILFVAGMLEGKLKEGEDDCHSN